MPTSVLNWQLPVNRPTSSMPTMCLAHVADLHGVVFGLRRWLKAAGVAVIEAPYLKDTIEPDRLFEPNLHEHLCYFSR
jgi:short-subunit dehydrogenase involved in D-alanine esterification of teichoic acids